jgi:hypothetical protein
VIKKGYKSNDVISGRIESNSLMEGLEKQNLTNNSFFIQKAQIEVSSDEVNQKFNGSIKFVTPGKYLISLKSKAGIEAARIFLSDDTILINDRINRKLYYGKPEVLNRKYGISSSLIPIVLGDYVKDNKSNNENIPCSEGKLDLESFVNGLKISYTVDCKKAKIILAQQKGSLNNVVTEINYGDFIKTGDILTPAKIHIKYIKSMVNIDIRIEKIESPWNGNIEFIPGNKYELIELR